MKALIRTAILIALAGSSSWAGEVEIGKMLGQPKRCYVARFTGPKEAIARYEKGQKDRFEQVDPTVIARLSKSVAVAVAMEPPKERGMWCASGDGTFKPEKIVFAAKGGSEPLLTIELQGEPGTMANLAGAEFSYFDGHAELPVAELERLAGKDLDLHLVFAGRVQKESWKKDYAAKILN